MKVSCPVLTIAALVSAGCTSSGLQPDTPALRSSLTPVSKTEIEQIVATASGASQVTLADDALAESSQLIVESSARRRLDAPNAGGRDYGRPAHFSLILDGPQCFLVHDETGLRYMLRDTECIAE